MQPGVYVRITRGYNGTPVTISFWIIFIHPLPEYLKKNTIKMKFVSNINLYSVLITSPDIHSFTPTQRCLTGSNVQKFIKHGWCCGYFIQCKAFQCKIYIKSTINVNFTNTHSIFAINTRTERSHLQFLYSDIRSAYYNSTMSQPLTGNCVIEKLLCKISSLVFHINIWLFSVAPVGGWIRRNLCRYYCGSPFSFHLINVEL